MRYAIAIILSWTLLQLERPSLGQEVWTVFIPVGDFRYDERDESGLTGTDVFIYGDQGQLKNRAMANRLAFDANRFGLNRWPFNAEDLTPAEDSVLRFEAIKGVSELSPKAEKLFKLEHGTDEVVFEFPKNNSNEALVFYVVAKSELRTRATYTSFYVPIASLDERTKKFLEKHRSPEDSLNRKFIGSEELTVRFLRKGDAGRKFVSISVDKPKPMNTPPPSSLETRTWTLADGSKFEAAFKTYSSGRIKVVLEDGGSRILKMIELSDGDQAYVKTVR